MGSRIHPSGQMSNAAPEDGDKSSNGGERELQQLVDATPSLLHSARPDGYIDFFNRGWLQLLGLQLEDVQGWRWTSAIHPDDREKFVAKWRESLWTGQAFEAESRVRRADGEYRWFLHRKEPLRDASGQIVKWYGSSIDIEDRKRAEKRIVRKEEELRQLLDVVPQQIFVLGEDLLPAYANRAVLEYHGAKVDDVPPDAVLASQTVHHPDDVARLWEAGQRAVSNGTPLETEARILGKAGEYRWFLIRMNPFRDENGQITRWYGTRTDIDDQKHAEEKIRHQEREVREILDLVPHHIGAYGPEGTTRLYANRVLLDYYGLNLEQLQAPENDIPAMVVHPDDLPSFVAARNRGFAASSEWETEARFRRRDGQYRWFLVRVTPLRDEEGRILRWYITGTDIDDRKKAADKVRQQERELREVVDVVPHHIAVATPDGTHIYGNHVMLDYYGLAPEDVQDSGIEELARHFMHPDDVEGFLATWQCGFAGAVAWETEARFRRQDGEHRWFLVRVIPFHDDGGRTVRWYVTGTDIDDRKKAEEKVRQDERALRLVFDVVPAQIVVLDPTRRSLDANRALLDFWGFGSLEELTAVEFPLANRCHPDDIDKLPDTILAFAAGEPHELEIRVRRHDGQYRWLLVRWVPLRDDQGRIIRWYAAGTDIDDRKRAEDRAQEENVALREEIDKISMFEEIVGASPALRAVLARVSKVAPTDSTVLITGETGTGKELVARAIHKSSRRANRAFVSVNCAAIPQALITSELFGHEKGAFTGALQRRVGRFELAEGGTLFLDEVGELPMDTQIALLRVLQEREFERVGGNKPIRTNVRVIAATNRELQAAITAGTFRSDLLYRLNVFPIEVPSLRDRVDDVPMLVKYFIDRYARKLGRKIRRIDSGTIRLLQTYPWPGNIRELQNVIERSVILCETEEFSIDESWLPRQEAARPLQAVEPMPVAREAANKRAAQLKEKVTIEAALAETRGRVSGPYGAAAKLGLRPTTLEARIRSLGVDKHQFKSG